VNKFYNWREIAKINKLEEDVRLLGNEVKQLKESQESQGKKIEQLKDSQDELKNLFLNFARQSEINFNNIFDKLNQMSTEQNRNNPNNNSKSCNMLKRKRKMSHN
jgi:hypothetical protein